MVQPFPDLRTKPFEFGMQFSGLFLSLRAQMLQQSDMAFILALRVDGGGELREDIHVPNFSGAFSEATQFLQDRLRDPCVVEG